MTIYQLSCFEMLSLWNCAKFTLFVHQLFAVVNIIKASSVVFLLSNCVFFSNKIFKTSFHVHLNLMYSFLFEMMKENIQVFRQCIWLIHLSVTSHWILPMNYSKTAFLRKLLNLVRTWELLEYTMYSLQNISLYITCLTLTMLTFNRPCIKLPMEKLMKFSQS